MYVGRCPQSGELVVGEVNPSQRVWIVVTSWDTIDTLNMKFSVPFHMLLLKHPAAVIN